MWSIPRISASISGRRRSRSGNCSQSSAPGSGTYLYYGRHFRTERVQLDPVEVHNDYLHLLAEYGSARRRGFSAISRRASLAAGSPTKGWGRAGWHSRGILPSNDLALNIGAFGAVAAYLVHSAFDFNLHIPANVCCSRLSLEFSPTPDGIASAKKRAQLARHRLAYGRLALPLLALAPPGGSLRYARAEYFAESARVALRDERHLAAMRWAKQAVALDDQNPETFFYLGESRVRRAEALSQSAGRPFILRGGAGAVPARAGPRA